MPLTTCFPFYSTPKNKRPAAMVADRRTSGPLPAGSTPCGPHRGRFHAPDRMTWGVCRRVRTRTAAGAYLLPQPPPAGSTPCGPHLEVPAGVRRYLPTPPPRPHTPPPAGSTPCGPHRGRFYAPDRRTGGRTPAVGVGGRRRPNHHADSRPATPHGRFHARIAGWTHARRPVRIFMTGPDQLNICPGGDLWPFFSVFFSTVNLFSEGSIDSLIAVLMA